MHDTERTITETSQRLHNLDAKQTELQQHLFPDPLFEKQRE